MIIFDLACVCGYQFEGWFQCREEFEAQSKSQMLLCPECGSDNIHKILSPVAAVRSGACVSEVPDGAAGSAGNERIASTLARLQDYVVKNFEDVGTKLAEETLKMHYGVEKARNIRGVATEDEEKVLKSEGIKFLKIPMPVKEEEPN
ncbi:MAG: DUF1178 family protein [Desulfobulbaceae bacterium]|nr:DUF1178 family protein [Desulfobulbaceae bacterium]MCK5436693.1 DUF1178 family protein [Desulfobulbaceae bacterium]